MPRKILAQNGPRRPSDLWKNPNTKQKWAAVRSLEKSQHETEVGGRQISGKIPTQKGCSKNKVCREESRIPNFEINFDFQ